MTLWPCGLARSHDKLKSLYHHYQNAYGHQTWHEGNLPWWTATYKVIWPFNLLVLRDHVINQNHISTTTVLITNKLARMVAYVDGLLPTKSHDPFIAWSLMFMQQTKIIFIFTATVPVASILGKMIIYLNGRLLISIVSLRSRVLWDDHVTT